MGGMPSITLIRWSGAANMPLPAGSATASAVMSSCGVSIRVDHMALRIVEGQGQGRAGMVYGPGGDTIQGEAAGGIAGVPDGHTGILDGVPVERLAEGHVQDARSRIVV